MAESDARYMVRMLEVRETLASLEFLAAAIKEDKADGVDYTQDAKLMAEMRTAYSNRKQYLKERDAN